MKYVRTDLVVVAGARTPFGSFGGSLSALTATDLGILAASAALKKSQVEPLKIDHVIMGNVLQTSKDAIYLSRHTALRSGMREDCPGTTVNQLCGSGVRAVADAEMLIAAGQAKYVVAGGTDCLSMTPYMSWGIRFGARMGHGQLWDGLDIRDTIPDLAMGQTAENLVDKFAISRVEQDSYALLSQERHQKAVRENYFENEIVPVDGKDKKGKPNLVMRDEHARPDTTMDGLSQLKPAFKAGGTVTAGNACGIVDGACALVLTDYSTAEKDGLRPLVRVVSWAVTGVAPEIMGIGPVAAIPLALQRANLKLEDIDLFEINEAFASQLIACEKELHLDRDKLNVNGGSIAIGHPFGATGARLILTLSLEMSRRKVRYGIVSLCIGGGMGIAMILERL